MGKRASDAETSGLGGETVGSTSDPGSSGTESDAQNSKIQTSKVRSGPGNLLASAAALDTLAVLFFVLIGAYVAQGLWPDPATSLLVLNPKDHALQEWHLGHATRLWTGEIPLSLVTDRMNSPDGINLMANVSFLLLGALMSPITLAFGAPVSFAILVGGNIAATAAAWYLLFTRTFRVHRLAALFGALFCGFAPGMISQSVAHPHMAAGWLVPAIVWCVVRLAAGQRPVRTGLILAALVAAYVFIAEEVLFLTALSLGVFTLTYAISDPSRAKAALRPMLTGLGVTTVAAGVVLAYPLWVQFAGRLSVPSGIFSPAYFSADLASITAFSPLSLAGNEANARLATGPSEYNTFLGAPLVMVAVAIAVWLWRVPAARAATVTAVVMLALALGPEIVLDTHRPGWPAPFRYVAMVPGLGDVIVHALPSRFALAAIPCLGVLFALAVHRALTSASLRLLVPVAVAVAMLPIAPAPLPTGYRPPVPAFVVDGHWRQCVRPGGVLVPVPLPSPEDADPLRWAAAANVRFGVPQGYFIAPYAEGGQGTFGVYPQPTAQLLNKVAESGEVPQIGDGERAQARADVAHWRASCVALAAGPAAVPRADALRRALDALYGPGELIVDAWVWRV